MKTLVALLVLAVLSAAPAFALEWIAIWQEDDSWVGLSDDGQIWQLIPGNPPDLVGSLGSGPWVDFARTTQYPHQLYALKPSGEIWMWEFWGPATIYRTLPGDRGWCALQLDQEVGAPPAYALSCSGEVWLLTDPPRYLDTFAPPPPSPTLTTSWGRVKGAYR